MIKISARDEIFTKLFFPSGANITNVDPKRSQKNI